MSYFNVKRLDDGSSIVIIDKGQDEEEELVLPRATIWRMVFAEEVANHIIVSHKTPQDYVFDIPRSGKPWNFHSHVRWSKKSQVWTVKFGLNATLFRQVRSPIGKQVTKQLRPEAMSEPDRAWVTYMTVCETLSPLQYCVITKTDPNKFGIGVWLDYSSKLRDNMVRQTATSFTYLLGLAKDIESDMASFVY